MADDPRTLADAHWKALRGGSRSRGDELLAQLRRVGGGDDAGSEGRRALAGALARAHCRRPDADEAERFELSKALSTAHWDAVRFGDPKRAARILAELRDLAKRGEATEGQRQALAEALANEIRHHAGRQGDPARAESLLADLRKLADRAHAPEEQRDALARALLDLHRESGRQESGDKPLNGRTDELKTLASRPASTSAQHLAYVEALQDAPWEAGLFGHRRRQEALLAAIRQAEHAARGNARAGTLLGDVLARMHAKVRRAGDDEFAELLLDRLRVLSMASDATIEHWITLAGGVCDGLWVSDSFANRELAEELVEILHLLTGQVEAGTRQRMALAGLLVGAHHRAVRREDDRVSKELLTLLHAWAVRDGATREEREVLGHGLALADEHARARGDEALAAKIATALATLPADTRAAGAGGALAELAAGS